MNSDGLFVFIFQAIIALFAFFVVAPCVLNAISLFTVQKRFAQTMVDLGVVKQADVQRIHPKKATAGVIISAVVLGVLVYGAIRTAPVGYFVAGIPLLAGFLKYRAIIQFNSLTASRFQKTYRDELNAEKYNAYIKKTF